MIVTPSIPDNNGDWQVFDNDEQILQFLFEEDVFSRHNQDRLSQNYGDQVIQLKANKMPRGLVTLETVFNKDDEVKKNKAGLVVQQERCVELELELGKSL